MTRADITTDSLIVHRYFHNIYYSKIALFTFSPKNICLFDEYHRQRRQTSNRQKNWERNKQMRCSFFEALNGTTHPYVASSESPLWTQLFAFLFFSMIPSFKSIFFCKKRKGNTNEKYLPLLFLCKQMRNTTFLITIAIVRVFSTNSFQVILTEWDFNAN